MLRSPRAFSAALYTVQFVVRYLRRPQFVSLITQAYSSWEGDLRNNALYNHQPPQSALQSKTPMQAMKQWHQTHPELFNKRPYDRPGYDN